MAKYLDKTGLSHLWDKIKAYGNAHWGGGGGGTWGSITGTLSNQTDLKNALDGKASTNNPTITFENGVTMSGRSGGFSTHYIESSYPSYANTVSEVYVGSAGAHLSAMTKKPSSCGYNYEVASINVYNNNYSFSLEDVIVLKAPTGFSGRLTGTWYGTLTTSSARSKKHGIKDFDEKHDVLFDNLKPRTFVYNDGDSKRTHYGFILDELGDALHEAKISSYDCAAYALRNIDNPNGDGGIVYPEFIAMNTWQIQKLKARVDELERKVAELEQK